MSSCAYARPAFLASARASGESRSKTRAVTVGVDRCSAPSCGCAATGGASARLLSLYRFCRRWLPRDEAKRLDFLRDAVFENLKIRRLQVLDRSSFFVFNDDVQPDFVTAHTNHVVLVLSGCLRTRRTGEKPSETMSKRLKNGFIFLVLSMPQIYSDEYGL